MTNETEQVKKEIKRRRKAEKRRQEKKNSESLRSLVSSLEDLSAQVAGLRHDSQERFLREQSEEVTKFVELLESREFVGRHPITEGYKQLLLDNLASIRAIINNIEDIVEEAETAK